MSTFSAFDGTVLSYRVVGQGDPLVVLPGGPMQDASYLGDLGGLPGHRRLVILDPRGTGSSATPAHPATYRCDRQVADVEALRLHLSLDRIDLLGHSAGANLAVLYAAAHPGLVGRLVLVTPSLFAVGLDPTADDRLAVARLRVGEPWYPEAIAALERLVAGARADPEAITPFFHGRYDAAAKAAVEGPARNMEAARIFGSDGAYSPAATRAALGELAARVLLIAGQYDVNSVPAKVEAFAALFPAAECVVQSGAGHYPWLDDPRTFVATVSSWLAAQPDSESK
ncbi:alpha/beta fold hydrolase [Herbidospora yilanensis]|uniref:alpha/beta fold hydrolase n=1 Tax=Herbidospora yilanensis TaxID=354426 RepID=UPI0007826E59|nr:alpha/beta hydrolase [Herbidospora yilanensis]